MMKRLAYLLSLTTLLLTAPVVGIDEWDIYNERYEVSQGLEHQPNEDLLDLIEPFRMPDNHPIKDQLDKLFSKSRVTSSRKTLVAAGFEDKKPEPATKIIVTRHKKMKGYIFKIYTDDYTNYHHGDHEALTYLRRARGAKLVRDEVQKQGWEKYYKVPQKWIYVLPVSPGPLRPEHFHRGFILVEEEMDLLDKVTMKKKWKDGTMTKKDLDRIFYLATHLGLRGCCKYDNIPICHDGRIAFVDTESNLTWPIAYNRFIRKLDGDMLEHWRQLIKHPESIPRIVDADDSNY